MFTYQLSHFHFDQLGKLIREGLPRGAAMLSRLLGPIFTNHIVLSVAAVAGMSAISVQSNLKFLVGAPAWGISGAVLMMSALHLASKNLIGLGKMMKQALGYVLVIICPIALILIFGSSLLAEIYIDTPGEIRTMAAHAIAWYGAALPFTAINFIISNYMDGIGRKKGAYLWNALNEFIGIVICMYLCGKLFGTEGLWASYLVEQLLLIAAYLLYGMLYPSPHKGIRKWLLLKKDQVASPENVFAFDVRDLKDVTRYSEKLHAFALDRGLPAKRSYHLALCFEERAKNIIEHGFGPDQANRLEVRVLIENARVSLQLTDNCSQFNFKQFAENMTNNATEQNIGTKIIMHTAKDIIYSNTMNANNLTIVM